MTAGSADPLATRGDPVPEAATLLRVRLPDWPGATRTRVLTLLANGERVEVASARDAAGALAQARSFILSLDERRPGEWPFAGGRFLRPDAIVSVDVAEPRRD